VFGWLRRRSAEEKGKRRLLIAMARAEEALIDAHVTNVLNVQEAVGPELTFDKVLQLYLDSMERDEMRAAVVARRAMAGRAAVERIGEAGRAPRVRRRRAGG
jgi:hypothetical protein